MAKENKEFTLRRTAQEVKRYRALKRIIPVAIACIVLILILVYVVTVLYSRYGSFTVTVNKFNNMDIVLTLSETADFRDPISRLNAKASEEITNIDGTSLPGFLDELDGEHSGANYMAYTFYCKNAGKEACSYTYELVIANTSLDIEKAIRVRLYVDGVATDYAFPATDGSGAEPGTVKFDSTSTVTHGQIDDFAPGAVTKYTVVVWLEGNDPDCLDNIIGGEFKLDMYLSVLTEADTNE